MNELKSAADKFLNAIDGGDSLTGRELEAARAWFAEKKNSYRVRQINAILRDRLNARLGVR